MEWYIDKDKYAFISNIDEDFVAGEDQYEYYVYRFKDLKLVECEDSDQQYSIVDKSVTYAEAIYYLNKNA